MGLGQDATRARNRSSMQSLASWPDVGDLGGARLGWPPEEPASRRLGRAISFGRSTEERLGQRNGRRGRRTEPGVFQPDSAERAFVPEADALDARVDLNTGRRAIAVRAGFMEALIADPRVVLRFHAWVEQLATAPDTLNTDDVLPLVL